MPSRYLNQLSGGVSPEVDHHHDSHHRREHILVHVISPVISVVAVLVCLGFLVVVFVVYRKRTRKRTAPGSPEIKFSSGRHCKKLSYNLLRHATCSFSPANKLGHGGFGAVYKVSIPSPHLPVAAAVKVLTPGDSIQGEREFYNELSIASSLNSRYTVSLLGFSSNVRKGEFLLVYELMENRSLQEALLDRKCGELMNWKKRFEVISRIAKGLEYLHFFCDPPIIHGDVKPSNVLLDANFNAKISDFGLAREKISEVSCQEDEAEMESVITASPEIGPEAGAAKKETKEYVMKWMGNEINHEMSLNCLTDRVRDVGRLEAVTEKKWKMLRCWRSFDEEPMKKTKVKQPKEWWREEFCDELTRKKENQTRKKRGHGGMEAWWKEEDEGWCEAGARQKKKLRSLKNSKESNEWWSEELSEEFKQGKSNSHECTSGEIFKSGTGSSTPIWRGTMCYVAPEYGGGGGGHLSEKCDVYSYGVLLLVVISGRRPLQVTSSPLSEFERANLISWAKQLACSGRLMELVDPDIENLDKDQALSCITVALLCLQKAPCKRPTMKEIVEMLSGEGEAPNLPLEFSPSPPSGFPLKTRNMFR